MKQILFIFTAILLATSAAFAQNSDQPVISAEEVVYDFGQIKESDGPISHTFQVSNVGGAPMVITRVIASCGCTTPKWTKEPIAPGQNGTVSITFDPANRPGPFAKTISVYGNGKKGSFILTIRGDVVE